MLFGSVQRIICLLCCRSIHGLRIVLYIVFGKRSDNATSVSSIYIGHYIVNIRLYCHDIM